MIRVQGEHACMCWGSYTIITSQHLVHHLPCGLNKSWFFFSYFVQGKDEGHDFVSVQVIFFLGNMQVIDSTFKSWTYLNGILHDPHQWYLFAPFQTGNLELTVCSFSPPPTPPPIRPFPHMPLTLPLYIYDNATSLSMTRWPLCIDKKKYRV